MSLPQASPGREGRFARVLVCRGCCCGTEHEHPDVDHDAQVEALRAVARFGWSTASTSVPSRTS